VEASLICGTFSTCFYLAQGGKCPDADILLLDKAADAFYLKEVGRFFGNMNHKRDLSAQYLSFFVTPAAFFF